MHSTPQTLGAILNHPGVSIVAAIRNELMLEHSLNISRSSLETPPLRDSGSPKNSPGEKKLNSILKKPRDASPSQLESESADIRDLYTNL